MSAFFLTDYLHQHPSYNMTRVCVDAYLPASECIQTGGSSLRVYMNYCTAIPTLQAAAAEAPTPTQINTKMGKLIPKRSSKAWRA